MATKKEDHEYRLKIIPYTDERKGMEGHLFELTTLAEFKTFMYDILVDIGVENKTITLTIHGISTPQFSMPEHGPAVYREALYDLRGTHSVVISKLNGPEVKFDVRFTPKKTIRKGRAKKSFVELETTHKE
jgi:hypothetical protein